MVFNWLWDPRENVQIMKKKKVIDGLNIDPLNQIKYENFIFIFN